MRTSVQKWGNSLAVRIPKPFAEEIGVDEDTDVDMSVVEGRLVVSPVRRPQYELEDLLEGVSDENLHREVDTGPPAGDEVW